MYFAVFVVTVPFVYRYIALCRNHVLSNGMLAALVFAEVTLAFVLIAYVFKACGASALQHTKDFEESNHELSERVIVFFAAEDLTGFPVVSVLIMAGAFVSGNYGIIAWCSYKIMRKIRSAPSTSRRRDAVNRQMNYILTMQALSPLILAVLPTVSAYYSILSSSRNPVLQFLVAQVTTVLAWTAVLNPLYTIFFVKAYRVTVKRLAQGLLTHSTTVTSITPDGQADDVS